MKGSDLGFWEACAVLVRSHAATVDRPMGSLHPRHADMIYPRDYGYQQGTAVGDGSGIGGWLRSRGDTALVAIACTVALRKRDAEMTLLLRAQRTRFSL